MRKILLFVVLLVSLVLAGCKPGSGGGSGGYMSQLQHDHAPRVVLAVHFINVEAV